MSGSIRGLYCQQWSSGRRFGQSPVRGNSSLDLAISLTLLRVCDMRMRQGERMPEGCDCCGRDAEDCGMHEAGWVLDARLLASQGVYCRTCAHLLRIVRLTAQCAWCEAPMVEEERAELEGWGYYADDLGELHPCCPGCLAERFGIDTRIRLRRGQ